jgi:hypothetical protein
VPSRDGREVAVSRHQLAGDHRGHVVDEAVAHGGIQVIQVAIVDRCDHRPVGGGASRLCAELVDHALERLPAARLSFGCCCGQLAGEAVDGRGHRLHAGPVAGRIVGVEQRVVVADPVEVADHACARRDRPALVVAHVEAGFRGEPLDEHGMGELIAFAQRAGVEGGDPVEQRAAPGAQGLDVDATDRREHGIEPVVAEVRRRQRIERDLEIPVLDQQGGQGGAADALGGRGCHRARRRGAGPVVAAPGKRCGGDRRGDRGAQGGQQQRPHLPRVPGRTIPGDRSGAWRPSRQAGLTAELR